MRTALAESGKGSRTGLQSADAALDETLLSRLRLDDEAAFRSIVEIHLPFVIAIARRMLGGDRDAEDVAQETLVRLWRNRATLELGAGGLRPWLRRVASNLSIDRIRSARPINSDVEVPEQSIAPTQMREIEEQHLATRVGSALAALPARQRLAITLFHYEGASQTDVAAALEISEEAVESLLARGRRTLKSKLASEWRALLPDDETPA